MEGRVRLRISAVLCCCLFSSASLAQLNRQILLGTQEDRNLTAALPENPQPQSSANSQSQEKQQSSPPTQGTQKSSPPHQQGAPSLSDLGFPSEATKPNPEEQARLDKRSHMLKIHQRLGLITAAPLVATVVAGSMAGGKTTSSSTRDLHAALGATTAGLYITTASYAIFAPKIKGTETRGSIRWHKGLAWVHGPGMILTPILGALAFEQKSRGERVHGIASAHAPVAYVTAIAYGAAIASVSFKF